MKDGIIVCDGGYLAQTKAIALAQRGVYLLTPTRKNMRHLASYFQLTCLRLCHRVEALLTFSTVLLVWCASPIALLMHYLFTCCAVYSHTRCTRP
jgi:hypothetical protein